jgi:hypothetical protein
MKTSNSVDLKPWFDYHWYTVYICNHTIVIMITLIPFAHLFLGCSNGYIWEGSADIQHGGWLFLHCEEVHQQISVQLQHWLSVCHDQPLNLSARVWLQVDSCWTHTQSIIWTLIWISFQLTPSFFSRSSTNPCFSLPPSLCLSQGGVV